MSSTSKGDLLVPRAPSVWIDLRPPHHGWLDCTIELGDFRLVESASGVFNDPLAELIDTGIFLARRASGTRRVFLWAEPGGSALEVWNVGDALAQVRIGSAAEYVPPTDDRTLDHEHECTVERTILAHAIHRAVDEILRSPGPGFETHWSDPTQYAAAVAELRKLVG